MYCFVEVLNRVYLVGIMGCIGSSEMRCLDELGPDSVESLRKELICFSLVAALHQLVYELLGDRIVEIRV